jgi:hypothetical protein
LGGAKEKKAKIAKSKSTHEILGGYEDDLDAPYVPGAGRAGRRRKSSLAPEPGADENGSLSSWARYLKTKYGKGPQKSFEGSAPSSPSSEDHHQAQHQAVVERPKRHSFSFPAHQYMNKNRIQFKFGSRGSEPGKLTWPRGICCHADGPDGTVQVVVADST